MGVSGNSVAGKSFQIFTVSEELLAKVVEAVQAGEKEARSSGNIQSFEVFCHGFRANISLGRLMVVPSKVCNDRKDFPTALLHGALVKVFGWGGEEIADLIEKKIGESEFDEYSQADFDTLKKELFTDPKTGKDASLIVFAPNWMNSREYITFHFTDDANALKNNLRHQVFSAYYNPAVSSAFNALMTNVDTTKVDVTDITPKLSYPFITENPLKQYPQLDKSASHKKATILLNRKTADDVTKQTLEPQELDVFEALDTALSNSLLPDADGAQGEGGFTAPEAQSGVPRAASKDDDEADYHNKMEGKGSKKKPSQDEQEAHMSADKSACAPHETPFTNVGPGSAAHAEQEASAPAMKETVGEDDPEHRMMDGDPIGIAIDENGVPRREDAKAAAKKEAKPADNQSNRTHDTSHPETLRVGQERLSSAYSAAYNGGFVDKHDMPPATVRAYLNEHMGNNNEYAPHAVADHQKQVEAGAFGEDSLNRLSNAKWGSVTAAEVKAGFVAEHLAADIANEPYEAMSDKAKQARAKKESLLDKFRPKTAVELDIDSIWDSITEDMGPAPIVELDADPNNPAPSNTEDQGGWNESTEENAAPKGRPNKKDVQDLPEAFRSTEPEDKKEISDSEAESEETGFENEVTKEEEHHEGSWRLDSKLADFVDEVYGEYQGDNVKEADGENPEPNAAWGITPEEGERLINTVQHGDRVTILRPAGRGRDGQEWAEASGKAVMHSSHGGWVLNMGGQHGTPGLADAGNILAVRKAKNQQPGLGRLGADKQADTADNGWDVDGAAEPTNDELGKSDTVECHEDYNEQQSKGAAAKKEYEKCDQCGKQAEISKELIAGQPLKKVNCKHCGNKKTKAGAKIGSAFEMARIITALEQAGFQENEDEGYLEHPQYGVFEDQSSPNGILVGLNGKTYTDYSKLMTAIKQLGAAKHADTADNPAEMAGGEGIIQPKTDADVKDTSGPTPVNTKSAGTPNEDAADEGCKHEWRKDGTCACGARRGKKGADISGDASEAKAETVSPDTVDKDIQQPTKSVEEAAKVAATWMNEYEIDEAMNILGNDPLLGKYVRFLEEFKNQVNSHSDGWPYWKLPAHAAGQLMTLLKAAMDMKRYGRTTSESAPQEVTEQMLRKAMGPIKAFYTRRGTAAGMEFPKLANDISGDVSEAKSEVDYNKAEVADEPKATDTVNPEHFAAKGECNECGGKRSLDKNHLCSECKHDAKAAAIGERNDDVPVSQGDIPNEKQPKSDLSGVQPEAHDVPPQVDSKVACGADQPESIEFDFGAGDLADIVLTEDVDESAE